MSDEIKRVRVLHGHVSPETGYLVPDYPYGYTLRCQIRYWIDTATKGAKRGQQRFASQTTNPKRADEPWNTPKRGTYSLMEWMYLDDDDHVQHLGISEFGVSPSLDACIRLSGIDDQMTDQERANYTALLTVARSYQPPWQEWDELIDGLADHLRTTGQAPELVNEAITLVNGRRFYIGATGMAIRLAVARQRV